MIRAHCGFDRCAFNDRSPENVLCSRQFGHNPMDDLQSAKLAPGIVRTHLTIRVGVSEQMTPSVADAFGVGGGFVDSLQDRL